MILDRAINRRFLCRGCTCVNMRKKSRGWEEIEGVVKWYIQKPTCDTVSFESVWACDQKRFSQSRRAQRSTERLRSYGSICLRLPPSPFVTVCLSHTREALTSRRIKRVIFLSPSVMVILPPYIFNSFLMNKQHEYFYVTPSFYKLLYSFK